jgi:gluconokinase
MAMMSLGKERSVGMDRAGAAPPPIVVVMGVAGSGKTTIGRMLAERLGVAYAEADSFHPPANVAKMAVGQALDDADRHPWLAAIADWIQARARAGEAGVVSCSALKRRYRDRLRKAHAGVWFLHLDATPDLITERVADRRGHFMPASLADSQFQTLEPLGPHEAGTVIDASAPPEEVTRAALARLRDHQASAWPEAPPSS